MRDAQVDVDIIGGRTAGVAAYRAVRAAGASATVSSGSFCATSNASRKRLPSWRCTFRGRPPGRRKSRSSPGPWSLRPARVRPARTLRGVISAAASSSLTVGREIPLRIDVFVCRRTDRSSGKRSNDSLGDRWFSDAQRGEQVLGHAARTGGIAFWISRPVKVSRPKWRQL